MTSACRVKTWCPKCTGLRHILASRATEEDIEKEEDEEGDEIKVRTLPEHWLDTWYKNPKRNPIFSSSPAAQVASSPDQDQDQAAAEDEDQIIIVVKSHSPDANGIWLRGLWLKEKNKMPGKEEAASAAAAYKYTDI